jgi:hypothetical protein
MRTRTSLGLIVASCTLLGGRALAQFSFSTANVPVGTAPDAAVVADLDGDGDLDLAVTSDAPDKVSLFFNAGDGTFGAPVNVFLASRTGPHTPVAGDLDGDGDIDLAVSLQKVDSVQLLVNTGGVFTPGASFAVGSRPRDLAIGDLDGDLDPDLVVVNRSGNSVTVLRNGGGLSFTMTTYLLGLDPREIALGDVTGDGLFDIAVAAHDSEAVVILRNLGAAAFANFASLSTSPRKPSGLTLARLDGNATLDVATAASNNGVESAVVFLNAGGGSFGAGTPFLLNGLNANSIVAADLDGDGDQDLATANEDSNDVSLLRNTGAGAFGAPQIVGVGTQPGQVVAADLDGNGATDLVTTNTGSGDVTVLLNGALGPSPMYSMCDPGDTGVDGCPCQNPPAGLGRGCDNSASTGGARLTASGTASLSGDTLVFTTSGERATALSIVLQGTTTIPAGTVYGQGMRCIGGVLKRLYVKNATGGSITAPAGGDPSVSARSAALGNPILPGQNRFYLVYYRDPVVLGGCAATSTFNATQGGRVSWTP